MMADVTAVTTNQIASVSQTVQPAIRKTSRTTTIALNRTTLPRNQTNRLKKLHAASPHTSSPKFQSPAHHEITTVDHDRLPEQHHIIKDTDQTVLIDHPHANDPQLDNKHRKTHQAKLTHVSKNKHTNENPPTVLIVNLAKTVTTTISNNVFNMQCNNPRKQLT